MVGGDSVLARGWGRGGINLSLDGGFQRWETSMSFSLGDLPPQVLGTHWQELPQKVQTRAGALSRGSVTFQLCGFGPIT